MALSLLFLLLSMVLDVTSLGLYGHDVIKSEYLFVGKNGSSADKYTGTYRFCFAMTLIGLLFKPFTLFVSYREYTTRGGILNLPFVKPSAYTGVAGGAGAATGGSPSAPPAIPARSPLDSAASAPPGYQQTKGGMDDGYQSASLAPPPFTPTAVGGYQATAYPPTATGGYQSTAYPPTGGYQSAVGGYQSQSGKPEVRDGTRPCQIRRTTTLT